MIGVSDLFMTCLVNERLDSKTLAIGRQGALLPGPYLLYVCKWLQVNYCVIPFQLKSGLWRPTGSLLLFGALPR